MRFFRNLNERTIVEVLHMLTEVYEERGNNNIPLTHNLEIISNSIAGRINIDQSNFNIYGYTVVCANNDAKNKRSNQRNESYLFGGSTVGDALMENLKNGGTSEDTASFQMYKGREKKDEFTGGEQEKELILRELLNWQTKLMYQGILLGRLLKNVLEDNDNAVKALQGVFEKHENLKELLIDALDVWELEELVEALRY